MDKYLFSYADASDPPVKRGLIRLVERATGQPKLKRMYLENQRHPRPGESFFGAAVRKLDLDVRYDADALDSIPKTGPVVIVANHPYGVLDGIVISWLVEKVRRDFVVLTNAVLTRAPMRCAVSSCRSTSAARTRRRESIWKAAPALAPIWNAAES